MNMEKKYDMKGYKLRFHKVVKKRTWRKTFSSRIYRDKSLDFITSAKNKNGELQPFFIQKTKQNKNFLVW